MMKSRFLQMICFFLAHDKNVFAFIKMSVSPSGPIKINQTVSIQCALKDDTVAAFFYTSANVYIPFCGLSGHTSGAECKPSDCAIAYNASCLNDTIFIVQYPVPLSWKGTSVYCRGLLSDERSNEVKLTVQDHGLDPPSSSPVIKASPPGFQYDSGTNITSDNHIIEITAGVVGVVMFVILFTVLVVFVWRDRSIKMKDMSENKSVNKK
ncbi:uncharacterized protein LOC134247723 [Saccostrea cucullata]|uniref:uncharacterized protein LOC134247723 n=1 Tax=Saccostrea cuccullata TaxID=36930 RepID=UPI002ED2AA13